MNDSGHLSPTHEPADKIADFLNRFIASSGLDLQFLQLTAMDSTAILTIEFMGSDTPVLTARNGETLHALEYMAARILRLDSTQHDQISFDADNFKQNRVLELQAAADAAIQSVRATDRPYAFPPMSSRERRLLHLAMAPSGLPTSSKGENPRRYVILYPEGYNPADPLPPRSNAPAGASAVDRTHAIRKTFRRR
jgi:spoIIIJ-associated protein